MRKLKEINYLDQLCFRIPADWIEHFNEDEGGMYHHEAADTGTLRLSLLIFKTEKQDSIQNHLENSNSSTDGENIVEKAILNDSTCLIRSIQSTTDEDGILKLYWWRFISNKVAGFTQIALFSFTVAEQDVHKQHIKDDLELLEKELKAVRFMQIYKKRPFLLKVLDNLCLRVTIKKVDSE